MNRSLARSLVLLSISICALAPVAREARAEETSVEMREAENRFKEGLVLHDRGKDEEARAKFLQAWAVLKNPNVLFNLARSEQLSGHDVDAFVHYRAYAAMSDARIADADRAKAQGFADECAKRIGRVEVTAPAGARISVDGAAPSAVAPVTEPLAVSAGKHVIVATSPEGDRRAEVEVAAGGTARADLGGAPSAAVENGHAVDSDHSTQRGFWTPRTTTAVALGGAAVVALGLGIYFGLASSSAADHASSIRAGVGPGGCTSGANPACATLADDVDAQGRDATIARVSYVAAGVFAAGAVATWFLWPHDERPKSGTRVTPVFGPRLAGAALSGDF